MDHTIALVSIPIAVLDFCTIAQDRQQAPNNDDIHVDNGDNDVGDDDDIEDMLKAPNKKENTKIIICPNMSIIHQVGGLCRY
jgi:hypothetical protein